VANICCRVIATFTGRSTICAAIAARMIWGRGVPFEPKPPPTCREITLTRSGGSSNTWATVSRAVGAPWFES
jgi:hypothetical protein